MPERPSSVTVPTTTTSAAQMRRRPSRVSASSFMVVPTGGGCGFGRKIPSGLVLLVRTRASSASSAAKTRNTPAARPASALMRLKLSLTGTWYGRLGLER